MRTHDYLVRAGGQRGLKNSKGLPEKCRNLLYRDRPREFLKQSQYVSTMQRL